MSNFEFFGPRKQIILKKLKLSSNFVDFKQTIIPAGDCFNEEWFFAMSIKGILQREPVIFWNEQLLQRVTGAFLQQATSDFLQLATSATSNKRILLRVTSEFCNGQLLQRVTTEFCNEQRVILQRVTSNEWISTSNEQRMKSYASHTSFSKFKWPILELLSEKWYTFCAKIWYTDHFILWSFFQKNCAFFLKI